MTASATVWLLDANVLISLTNASHIHHAEAHAWFDSRADRRWATCALTQLAFVRLTCNPKVVGETIRPEQAMQALAMMAAQPQHEYWSETPEPVRLAPLHSAALVGHRQVTDAYLLGLAADKQQRLATLDRGLLSFADAVGLHAHLELVSASRPGAQEAASIDRVARARSTTR